MDWACITYYFCAANKNSMAVKRTIAIIEHGVTTGLEVAQLLAKGDFRILLLSAATKDHLNTPDLIRHINPEAEIEIVQCQVDACWEADIVVLAVTVPEILEELVNKMKEVVTGKLVISILNKESCNSRLQQLLPNSSVISLDRAALNEKTVLFLADALAIEQPMQQTPARGIISH